MDVRNKSGTTLAALISAFSLYSFLMCLPVAHGEGEAPVTSSPGNGQTVLKEKTKYSAGFMGKTAKGSPFFLRCGVRVWANEDEEIVQSYPPFNELMTIGADPKTGQLTSILLSKAPDNSPIVRVPDIPSTDFNPKGSQKVSGVFRYYVGLAEGRRAWVCDVKTGVIAKCQPIETVAFQSDPSQINDDVDKACKNVIGVVASSFRVTDFEITETGKNGTIIKMGPATKEHEKLIKNNFEKLQGIVTKETANTIKVVAKKKKPHKKAPYVRPRQNRRSFLHPNRYGQAYG
jgi:hypothetical protein